ncbi:g-type lectin s-receptor-like serine/threonine-protein kinase [Quercus suber]|uniref:G-type lectin s-receptor-like serine/threonine-protein kinase n=1 Tax=Quercus suber TaxID=58331 RepID=A0AAW0LDZ5_QUESU
MVFTWSASHISFCTIYTFLFFLTSISFCSAGDTITFSNPINDSQKESLVSAEKRFELGFFTPNGSSKHRRYVGICYKSSPSVVVWVANRDNPLSKTTGAFTITDDGDLQSGVPGSLFYSDNNFLAIFSLLSNFSRKKMPTKLNLTKSIQIPESFHYYRLVMNFNGKAEFYIWDNEKTSWSFIWGEPEDKCSVFDACGDFSICNLGNGPMCKCLPGFESRSEGCFRKSPICNNNNNVMADHFLSLKMMKVRTQSTTKEKGSADECKEECRSDCNCQAYSYVITERTRHGTCYFWSNEVKNIQEQIEGGIDLYVQLTKRDCEPCGTTIIPYPLSIRSDCGDPMYSHFNCNDTSDQVSFGLAGGTYPVTIIHPEEQTFTIRVNNYTAIDVVRKLLELNHLPFNVTKSNLSSKEVEIWWKPPLSPICNSAKDCDDWPRSTCHTMKGGTKRCLCNTEFQWDPSNFNCTPVVHNELAVSHKKKNLLRAIIPVIVAILMEVQSALHLRCTVHCHTKQEEIQDNAIHMTIDKDDPEVSPALGELPDKDLIVVPQS